MLEALFAGYARRELADRPAPHIYSRAELISLSFLPWVKSQFAMRNPKLRKFLPSAEAADRTRQMFMSQERFHCGTS